MEHKTECKLSENEILWEKETVQFSPEDGDLHQTGYAAQKTISTNDPRVTKIEVTAFSVGFGLIGMIAMAFHWWGFGILFLGLAVYFFFSQMRKINEIAKEMKQKNRDVTIDSKEELHEIVSEVHGEMKAAYKESAAFVFTEKNMREMTRKTLPIYVVIGAVASAALGLAVHPALGILTALVFTVFGVLYYGILMKILVKSGKK